MIDILHKSRRTLVTGRTASGKSSLVEWLILNEYQDYSKIFVYDFEGEWCQRLGVVPVTSLGEIARSKERIICYDPVNEITDDPFDDYCLFVFEFAKSLRQKILVVIDELQMFVNVHALPTNFMSMLLRGRRYKIDMICISQQPNLIHNAVRSQVSEIATFGQSDSNAMKFTRSFGIFDDEVTKLDDLEFFRKRCGTGEIQKFKLNFTKKGVDIIRSENYNGNNETRDLPRNGADDGSSVVKG